MAEKFLYQVSCKKNNKCLFSPTLLFIESIYSTRICSNDLWRPVNSFRSEGNFVPVQAIFFT